VAARKMQRAAQKSVATAAFTCERVEDNGSSRRIEISELDAHIRRRRSLFGFDQLPSAPAAALK